VREDDQTVRNWLKRYVAEGIEGLHDRPLPGAPPKITPAYAEQTGLRLSDETVRLCLQRAGIVLSRPQHTSSSPDPEYAVKKRRSKTRATA